MGQGGVVEPSPASFGDSSGVGGGAPVDDGEGALEGVPCPEALEPGPHAAAMAGSGSHSHPDRRFHSDSTR